MAAKDGITSHGIVVTLSFELIGVALLAILADSNKKVGNIVVAIMVGFAFIWLMTTGTPFLQKIFAHAPGHSGKPGGVNIRT